MRGHDQAEHPSRAGRERSWRQLEPLPRVAAETESRRVVDEIAWRGDRARQHALRRYGRPPVRDEVVAKDRPTTPKRTQRDSGFPRTGRTEHEDAAVADRQCCGVKYMSITPGQELRHRE